MAAVRLHSLLLCCVSVQNRNQVFQIDHTVAGNITTLCLRPVCRSSGALVIFLCVCNVEQINLAVSIQIILGRNQRLCLACCNIAGQEYRLAVLIVSRNLYALQLNRRRTGLTGCGKGQARNIELIFLGQTAFCQIAKGQAALEGVALLGPLDAV